MKKREKKCEKSCAKALALSLDLLLILLVFFLFFVVAATQLNAVYTRNFFASSEKKRRHSSVNNSENCTKAERNGRVHGGMAEAFGSFPQLNTKTQKSNDEQKIRNKNTKASLSIKKNS